MNTDTFFWRDATLQRALCLLHGLGILSSCHSYISLPTLSSYPGEKALTFPLTGSIFLMPDLAGGSLERVSESRFVAINVKWIAKAVISALHAPASRRVRSFISFDPHSLFFSLLHTSTSRFNHLTLHVLFILICRERCRLGTCSRTFGPPTTSASSPATPSSSPSWSRARSSASFPRSKLKTLISFSYGLFCPSCALLSTPFGATRCPVFLLLVLLQLLISSFDLYPN